jgi:hypothetical protein
LQKKLRSSVGVTRGSGLQRTPIVLKCVGGEGRERTWEEGRVRGMGERGRDYVRVEEEEVMMCRRIWGGGG